MLGLLAVLAGPACVQEEPISGEVAQEELTSRSRVTGITITRREVAFSGASFGEVGTYEKVVGTLSLVIDPFDARHFII
jgi:hypothetical protein